MPDYDLGEVVGKDGTELTVDDSLNSTSKNPVQNKVINNALNSKASSSHTHSISDVDSLQLTLDGKASTSHTHTKSQISDFTHTHTVSEISDLDLSGKVNTSDIANNLTTTTAGKVLDARQGKALKDYVDGLVGDIEEDMLQ